MVGKGRAKRKERRRSCREGVFLYKGCCGMLSCVEVIGRAD